MGNVRKISAKNIQLYGSWRSSKVFNFLDKIPSFYEDNEDLCNF